MESNASVSIKNNVLIKVLDKNGKVKRHSEIHNKATSQMVIGLLKFLGGYFNPTKYNPNISSYASWKAADYIPSELRLGNGGIQITYNENIPHLEVYTKSVLEDINIDSTTITSATCDDYQEIYGLVDKLGQSIVRFTCTEIITDENDPPNTTYMWEVTVRGQFVETISNLNEYNIQIEGTPTIGDILSVTVLNGSAISTPKFSDTALDHEIPYITNPTPGEGVSYYNPPFKFETDEINVFNTNSSAEIVLNCFVTQGSLVYFTTYEDPDSPTKHYYTNDVVGGLNNGWVYKTNSNVGEGYEAIFTEIGLYSTNNTLLARVLFDNEFTLDNNAPVFDDPTSIFNPIVQTEEDSVVIQWKITITSIGQHEQTGASQEDIPYAHDSSF